MTDMTLAWRSFWHSLALPEQRLIIAVLTLMMGFLLVVATLGASIQQKLENNLHTMLGADVVLTRSQALDDTSMANLQNIVGAISDTRSVELTLSHKEHWQRVLLKVVDAHYPIQGQMTTLPEPGARPVVRDAGPPIGQIWLDHRLLIKLNLRLGQTLSLADTELTVSAILDHEPDRLLEGHSTLMRAMVSRDSMPAEWLASVSAQHRYLMIADEPQRLNLRRWQQVHFPEADLTDRHADRHPLADFWTRVENFFGLSSVLLFLIAAVALSMTGQRRTDSQRQRFALYASLGVTRARNLRIAIIEWLLGFSFAMLPGVLLAGLLQWLGIRELQPMLPGIEWGIHPHATLTTLGLLLALFFCLQLPALLSLWRTSIQTLMRDSRTSAGRLLPVTWTGVTLTLLAGVYSDNPLLTGMVLGALLAATILMLVATGLILYFGERLFRGRNGLLPIALLTMRHRNRSKTVQITSLGLCATLLLFTLMLMKDLGDQIFSHTRTHNGNLMISEAMADQVTDIELWANNTGSVLRDVREFRPALLTHINGRLPADHAGHPSETLSIIDEPIRLSWSKHVPNNNQLIDGRWWTDDDKNWQQISVEKEVMIDLDLQIGDELTFWIAGQSYRFTIAASHVFKSGGSSITFWFVAPEAAQAHLPGALHVMGSMELPDHAWPQLARLLNQHPTLAVVSLEQLTRRFDTMLGLVTRLTVAYSSMILLLSVAVLLAAIIAYGAEDRRRHGLLQSLGLQPEQCLRLVMMEWLITGAVAGLGAISGTWLAGQLIYRSQFQLNYHPDPAWMLMTAAGCCTVMVVMGVIAGRLTLRDSPRQLLAA